MDQTQLPEPVHVTIGGTAVATYMLLPAAPSKGDVVLCHGTPWSAQVWAEVARQLSSSHRVFLWDMPGYGRSAKDVPVDLPAQMTRFAALLSRWGLDRPHVVAHDIGGAVALGAHLIHGAQYADLFLWDVVTLAPWGSPFFRLVADHSDVFAELPAALHTVLVKEYIAGAARHRLPTAQVDALAQPWLGATGQPAFYRQIAALRPDHTRPVEEQLSEVRCPVRIGWGADDPWLPVDQALKLQALLPGAPSVVTLNDVGHLPPIEDPSAVSLALSEWLAQTH
ncbi:alpha/beta hydrolase [Kribbella antibiotica]|uniref:Alpha/beta hydrolase n=1 Tax=Kribbella antibiotica TaxID=190195 RepID=A0A4V2YQL4_9ACTN|nr:alpha/beta hydrolase [Kribbella antibiotica]TDD62537.1 alpha/beta hydrolase [Kribbella antibiotica]